MKVVFFVSLLSAALTAELAAQAAYLGFSPPDSPLLASIESQDVRPADSRGDLASFRSVLAKRTDYRWEFGIAGAALLGHTGAVAANAACNPDSTSRNCVGPVVGTAAVGALVGGVVGLFVGAGIEKQSEPPPE